MPISPLGTTTSYVTNNAIVQEFSGENLSGMFSDFQAGLYQPFTMLSLAIDYQLGGGKPFAFHLTNVLLHLLNTILVFVVVRRLMNEPRIALIAAALFGVHTLHVESVAWITERKDVLYALFYLLALWQYMVYIESQKLKNLAFALILMVCSLLSKGMAVALVPTLFLIDLYLGRSKELKKVLLEKLPFFAVALFFGWLALQGQSSSEAMAGDLGQGTTRQIAFAGYAFWVYLAKMLVPIKLSAVYSYPLAQGGGA